MTLGMWVMLVTRLPMPPTLVRVGRGPCPYVEHVELRLIILISMSQRSGQPLNNGRGLGR